MARSVSCLIDVHHAIKAGEVGHKKVERLLILHGRTKKTDDELVEYWGLRGSIGKAASRPDDADGSAAVNELLNTYDGLEWSRGVTLPASIEVREHKKDLFWVLRTRLANDIEAHNAA
jgi:hypothetical protein